MNKAKTGELIKNKRIEKGYTQQELGDLLGVSNKAVSRWEHGDSFPDIGVIESLSQILELKIQDIVTGELSEGDSEVTMTELLRMAKIQKQQHLRETLTAAIELVLLVYLLILGYRCLWRNTLGQQLSVLNFVSLFAIFFWLCFKCRSCSESLNPFRTKRNRWFALISLLSFTGITASLGTVSLILSRKRSLLFLPEKTIGPALLYLLVVVFCINFVLIAVSLWKHAFREEPLRLDIYFAVATLHLTLRYSNLLHAMSSVYSFTRTIFLDTGVVVLVTALAVSASVLIKYLANRTA